MSNFELYKYIAYSKRWKGRRERKKKRERERNKTKRKTNKAQCHPLLSRKHFPHFLSDNKTLISLPPPKKANKNGFPNTLWFLLLESFWFSLSFLLPHPCSSKWSRYRHFWKTQKYFSLWVKCPSDMLSQNGGHLSDTALTLHCYHQFTCLISKLDGSFLRSKTMSSIFAITSNYNSARHILTASKVSIAQSIYFCYSLWVRSKSHHNLILPYRKYYTDHHNPSPAIGRSSFQMLSKILKEVKI